MSEPVPSLPSHIPSEPIPLIDLVGQHREIRAEIAAAVTQVFDEQKFILGEEVAALEGEVAEYCDAREAIGVASGTDALILALMCLDLEPGDEVITSPFTFFATGSAIARLGLRPVFVDIDPRTFNLKPEAVSAAITRRSRAVIPVHLFGQCTEMEPLWRIATRAGLVVVEDACQAIGAEYRNRRAGVLGDLGCFSFFPTKNLGGAGDGGMITTDDPWLARRLRKLRVHGDAGQYEHVEIGLNSRLDALQAAVLRIKLRYLNDWTLARQRNARRYAMMLDEYGILDRLVLPEIGADRRHVFNQYTVRIPDGRRDSIMQSLREQQIGCAVYYPKPLHLQKCFSHLYYKPGDIPEAERASREVLSLPIFPELTEAQQERVVAGLAKAFDKTATPQHVVPAPKFLSNRVRAPRTPND